MIRLLICVLSVVLISSCDNIDNQEAKSLLNEYLNKKPVYLIQTGSFTSKEKAESAAVYLTNKVKYNLYIQKNLQVRDSLGQYVLQLGKFPSSFDAGKEAYKLRSSGDIGDYQIIRNKITVFDEFADIIFVGSIGNTTGIYKVNIFSGTPAKLWSKSGEMVADLDYSQNIGKAFFITLSGTGYIGIFPYIRKAKLYLVDILQNKVQLVKDFGDGIQIFSQWETNDFYRVRLLSFDKTNPIRVLEYDLILNGSGVPVSEERKVIDLDKENYPQITSNVINKMSPDGNYRLLDMRSQSNTQFYLFDKRKNEKILIKNSNHELMKCAWIEDNKGLIFLTSSAYNQRDNSKSKNISELNFYNIKHNRNIIIGKRDGAINFLIRGDLVIFDDGINKKSVIQVFDTKKNKHINKISIKGGCGINNIPILPGNK